MVWSEGAIPLSADELLAPGGGWAEIIRRSLHPGETLMFGAYRLAGPPSKPRAYNSLVAVRAETEGLKVTGVYDKHRLVPFGEYLPAEQILKPLGFKDLAHLSDSLGEGPWLLGEAFSLADIAISTALSMWQGALDGVLTERLAAYQSRATAREAHQRARGAG